VLRVALILLCAGAGGIFLGSAATTRLLETSQVQVAAVSAPIHKAKVSRVAAKFQLESPWLPDLLPSARAEYVSMPAYMRHTGKRAMTARNAQGRSERITF